MHVTIKGKPAMASGKGMAYLLTGQSKDWGKSSTLRALTGGNYRAHWIDIVSKKDGNAYKFFIRRTSNTDNPESFMNFIASTAHKNIIIAFSIGGPLAQNLLQTLSSRYRLRCFVLRHCWGNPAQAVTAAEMALLARFAVPGGVYDYSLQNSPDTARAAAFRAYMEAETPF
jgi:pimeloyl-ACP methyl ester carboxylesterase